MNSAASQPMLDDLPSLVDDHRSWHGLRDVLREMARQHSGHLRYVPNEGNAGDALGASGSWQFFDDIGVDPAYATVRELRQGDAAVYGSGSNDDGCGRFLERCLEVGVASALVMPQTIRGNEALLSRLDERFTLVCRDAASMRRVQATATRARLVFAPDMALYVDVLRLFERCAGYRKTGVWLLRFLFTGRLLPYLQWRDALRRRTPPRHGHVSLMRSDLEATPANLGDPRWDVSHLYRSRFGFREESDMVSRDFLSYFTRVSSVRTNRLHTGMAGALMGCDVTYFDNSNGKVGAVYHAWLSHLPFVTFNANIGSARTPQASRSR